MRCSHADRTARHRTRSRRAPRRHARGLRARARRARAQRGVALPVALILLVIITVLVTTQVRRSTSDERLAINSRDTQLMRSAAELVLRWCESRIIAAPLTTVTVAPTPGVAAWADPANWTADRTFTFTGVALPGAGPNTVTWNACLIEDASGELGVISPSVTGQVGESGFDPRTKKWRITAQVRYAEPDLRDIARPDVPAGVRAVFVQSEVRMYMNLVQP